MNVYMGMTKKFGTSLKLNVFNLQSSKYIQPSFLFYSTFMHKNPSVLTKKFSTHFFLWKKSFQNILLKEDSLRFQIKLRNFSQGTTLSDIKSKEEVYEEKRKHLHKKFKNFVAKVHPDLFTSTSEEYRKLNDGSIQQLNALFDAIWTYISKKDPTPFHDLPSPVLLKFVCKNSKQEFKLMKTSFVLPLSILVKDNYYEAVDLLWLFYEQCIDQLERDLAKHLSVVSVNNYSNFKTRRR